jgi:hypothetical protein
MAINVSSWWGGEAEASAWTAVFQAPPIHNGPSEQVPRVGAAVETVSRAERSGRSRQSSYFRSSHAAARGDCAANGDQPSWVISLC